MFSSWSLVTWTDKERSHQPANSLTTFWDESVFIHSLRPFYTAVSTGWAIFSSCLLRGLKSAYCVLLVARLHTVCQNSNASLLSPSFCFCPVLYFPHFPSYRLFLFYHQHLSYSSMYTFTLIPLSFYAPLSAPRDSTKWKRAITW